MKYKLTCLPIHTQKLGPSVVWSGQEKFCFLFCFVPVRRIFLPWTISQDFMIKFSANFFSQSLKLIQKVLNLWVLIKNKSKMINPKIHRQQVPMYTVCKTVNLWTFRSDLHETSPYIIHTSSKKQVILKLSVEVVIMI